jgi:hypothetical protein
MRALFLFFILMPLAAQAYECPKYIQNNAKALKALDFVKRFKGQFQLGKCQVEILTCEGWTEDDKSNPIAELLIVDGKGREVYATMSYPEFESEYISTKTSVSKRRLHFEKKDRLFEEEFGRTEVIRLEFKTEYGDEDQLQFIELGTYSTNHALNNSNGNDSKWFICKD